jgi:hypothetical protein
VELFNSLVTALFDALLYPLNFLGASWSVVLISIIAGIALLAVYGKVSNQQAIKKVKKSIAAGIYESVLFRNDLKISLKAQGKMFLGGLKYFGLAIPPILILMIPCLIILAQLNLRYGVRPLNVGESTIISVQVSDDSALFSAELKTPEGVTSTPPLRDLDNHTVSWRIDAKSAITDKVTIQIGDQSVSQDIFVGATSIKIPTETSTSPWWQFLYPGSTIPEQAKGLIKGISVSYPEQILSVMGIKSNWLIIFLIISILAGIVGSKFLKVEI